MNELLTWEEYDDAYQSENIQVDYESYEDALPRLNDQDAKTAAAKDAEYAPLVEAAKSTVRAVGIQPPEPESAYEGAPCLSCGGREQHKYWCFVGKLAEALRQLEESHE